MPPTRMKWAASVLCFSALLLRSHSSSSADAQPPRDSVIVSADVKGRLILIGRHLHEGEQAPDERAIMILQDPTRLYYRLREGDRVECGELLGRIDDSEARQEVEVKVARASAAEAELTMSETTCAEASVRHDRLVRIFRCCGSLEELDGAKLACERYLELVKVKKANLAVARLEVAKARLLLPLYEIRSPVRGTIQAIYKKKGAVSELEAIFRIKVDEQ